MNKIRDSLRVTQSVSDQVPYLNTLAPDPLFITLEDVEIKITGSTLLSAYKWKYQAKQVARKKDGTYEDVQVPVGTQISFPDAYNGYENGNTATSVNAIAKENPSDLPGNFDVVAIPNDVIVRAKLVAYLDASPSSNGSENYYWFFTLMNPMEGTCPDD
tara:strand:- start:979 stop:1455 length:477 start_codon:yes stop_codon:yes gene_type:complete